MSESATAGALPVKAPSESIAKFAKRSALPAAKEFGKAAAGLGLSAVLSGFVQNRLAKSAIQGTTAFALLAFKQSSMAMGAGINAVRSLIGAVLPTLTENGGMLDGADEQDLLIGNVGDEFDDIEFDDDIDDLMGVGEGYGEDEDWEDEYDALEGADDRQLLIT